MAWPRLIPGDFRQLSLHVAASAGFCLNLVLAAGTGYFDSDAASKPLLHIWSLGVEEQFYLIWPLVLWIAIRARINILRTAVFLAACSFLLNEYKVPSAYAADFFLPQMRFWELSIGCIAAVLYPSVARWRAGAASAAFAARLSNIASISGIALIGLALFVDQDISGVPDRTTLLPTVGAALLIFAGHSAWVNRRMLTLGPLVGLGLISYPLYLWHWPLLCFSRLILGDAETPATRFLAIAASVILAWLTYAFVESPIRRATYNAGSIAALVAAMTIVGGVGYATYLRNGFPGRFPRIIQELARFSYSYGEDWREGTYFLDAGIDETEFERDPHEIDPAKPTIFLWGDSHAAHLYRGYRGIIRVGPQHSRTNRRVDSPLLDAQVDGKPGARAFNWQIFETIRRIRPNVVVLSANWVVYDWKGISVTIAALQKLGIRHIVVVGPDPQWVGGLPQQIFNYYWSHRFDPIPRRLSSGASGEPMRVDAAMGPFCRALGAEYVSPAPSCTMTRDSSSGPATLPTR